MVFDEIWFLYIFYNFKTWKWDKTGSTVQNRKYSPKPKVQSKTGLWLTGSFGVLVKSHKNPANFEFSDVI